VLTQRIAELLERRPEVLEGYLFGSQARGEASSRSDVDVAVYVDLNVDQAAPYGLAADLATELDRQTRERLAQGFFER